jgi:hypothetical protein
VNSADAPVRDLLQGGLAIPACPLALTPERTLDVRRQRALVRYYHAAGAGGLAVGVHTTQFAIRERGLLKPVLELASSELIKLDAKTNRRSVRIAGICGVTTQALNEAALARELDYDAGLLSLGALREASDDQLIAHCRRVAEVIPIIGFYLQPSVGGRLLSHSFWLRFAEIEKVLAIKIAPFNRYQTIDVIRAVAEAGRDDIALYTGNDDNIVADLLTPFRFEVNGRLVERRIVGGLLGQWAVWTKRAVELLRECHRAASQPSIPSAFLSLGAELTDANSVIFDAAGNFHGCIPGIHEVLRRQGLLAGLWCLDPQEQLSPNQAEQLDRVTRAYPHLNDNCFVAEHLDEWLASP